MNNWKIAFFILVVIVYSIMTFAVGMITGILLNPKPPLNIENYTSVNGKGFGKYLEGNNEK